MQPAAIWYGRYGKARYLVVSSALGAPMENMRISSEQVQEDQMFFFPDLAVRGWETH